SSTSTVDSGRFVLKASESAGNLSFSLVGYLAREVGYPGVSLQTVALTKEDTAVDEVVVVVYGTVSNRDLAGSGAPEMWDEIAKVPSANILESIQGKVPGVDITRSSGSASSGVSMTVRGNRSITAQNGPLFIVDGVQYSNIQDINPNDIESMEILKDASSTAI